MAFPALLLHVYRSGPWRATDHQSPYPLKGGSRGPEYLRPHRGQWSHPRNPQGVNPCHVHASTSPSPICPDSARWSPAQVTGWAWELPRDWLPPVPR
ncbi:hypothetical protein ACFFX0_18470 [Citricoccus parietis]|uniref:Uncharacterized protein n=1 Tax=Citricoccus parietis TaxID=592307 RepID=A0ABV5G2B9_9MICC